MYIKNELEMIVLESKSYREVLIRLGKSVTGESYKCIKNAIIRLGINTDHFCFKRSDYNNKKIPWENILINNPNAKQRIKSYQLRRALIEFGMEYICAKCNIKEWHSNKLILEIDHIDGDWKNNSINNLRFLCPNCHSLTPNFYHIKKKYICECGLNKTKLSNKCHKCSCKNDRTKRRKVQRPDKDSLFKLIWEKPTSKIAKDFGISDTAIKKWCRRYNIEKPPRGYWQKIGYYNENLA